jgi:hypothetical protein
MSLLKIWKNKGKILEGIKNRIFTTEHIREVAEERMSKCLQCPHIDTKGDSCYAPGTQPCCGLCGCSLGLKTYSMSSECDDGRWDSVMTMDEEDELNDQLNSEE